MKNEVIVFLKNSLKDVLKTFREDRIGVIYILFGIAAVLSFTTFIIGWEYLFFLFCFLFIFGVFIYIIIKYFGGF